MSNVHGINVIMGIINLLIVEKYLPVGIFLISTILIFNTVI